MSTAIPIRQNRTVYIETKIHVIECANCSIDFGIGDDFMRRRREDHADFYCPNGHANVYRGDNEAERLRKELARAERQREWAQESVRSERQARQRAERQRAAAKGQVTKIRNRIANGVCPCCNRSFVDVRRHIAGQHPDFIIPRGDG